MKVLGISCYYHDAAACLVDDGVIVAAAQEERFTRIKHDAGFPANAVRYCLAEAGVRPGELAAVTFHERPDLKLRRLLATYLAVAPRGLSSFLQAGPSWLRKRLGLRRRLAESLRAAGLADVPRIHYPEHHESHAASAFYPSPFKRAAVLTLDGVGEWATGTIAVGDGGSLEVLEQLDFPHSLGLLYSAFTAFTGFRVNSGEYKLMGLAPYGEPIYADLIRDELMDLKPDGSLRLDMDYFGYLDGLAMTSPRFERLFGGPPRRPESPISRREMDLARSIQQVTEEVVLRAARHARALTGERHLCMAGGVALNCVANGVLLRAGVFDDLWIQPAAGDAGGALGAALLTYHRTYKQPRRVATAGDAMQGSYLGPEFSREQIAAFLDRHGYPHRALADDEWADEIAALVAAEKVVALCHGRMEFGPRALGNRSIIGDARSPRMQSVMNLKIKYRESFRPFAPSCLAERIGDYFDLDRPSPYMLLVAEVRRERCVPRRGDDQDLPLTEWVNRARSDLPAITHVDYTARVQSVDRATNPAYHAILRAFERRTGCGVIINTSFNVRGEPIVCTPEDAYRCFMRSEIDHLVLGPFVLDKQAQPPWLEDADWRAVLQGD